MVMLPHGRPCDTSTQRRRHSSRLRWRTTQSRVSRRALAPAASRACSSLSTASSGAAPCARCMCSAGSSHLANTMCTFQLVCCLRGAPAALLQHNRAAVYSRLSQCWEQHWLQLPTQEQRSRHQSKGVHALCVMPEQAMSRCMHCSSEQLLRACKTACGSPPAAQHPQGWEVAAAPGQHPPPQASGAALLSSCACADHARGLVEGLQGLTSVTC